MEDLQEDEESPVVTPQFDLFLLVVALKSEVGKLGGYENGEYGENEALNRHDIILQKN